MSREKHHYIEHTRLKDKYRTSEGKIKACSKAIADCTGVKIEVDKKANNTFLFVIIGNGSRVDKALTSIKQEFEISQKPRKRETFLELNSHVKLLKSKPKPGYPLLTREALLRHDILCGISELRQFSCKTCNSYWWKSVLRTKPVSDCLSCHVRYDALERSREFGIGRFVCLTCNHCFYAWCTASDEQVCFKCVDFVGPPFISPRFKAIKQRKPDIGRTGARPPNKVRNYSAPHDSTGSTVAESVITQDMGSDIFVRVHDDYAYDMPPGPGVEPIPEHLVEHSDVFDSDSEGSSDTSKGGSSDDLTTADSEDGNREKDAKDDTSESEGEEDSSNCEGEDRRREVASDSSESSEDEEKESLKSSKDSGIGTKSHTATGSGSSDKESGSAIAVHSEKSTSFWSLCNFKPEYSGVVFSKTDHEQSVTFKGGVIEGSGMKLTIPEGAIPCNEEITISLQACIGGPFELPDSHCLVSPIYLAQPPFAFRKDVTLEVELFAELKNKEDLLFITSLSKSIVEDGSAKWKFRVGNRKPSHHESKAIGVMKLRHFCFLGFSARKIAKMKFCSIYYCPQTFNSSRLCHIIFSVSTDHVVFKENLQRYIDEHYKNEKFDKQVKTVKISSERVTITVGKVEQSEYRISPLSEPCEIAIEDLRVSKKKKNIKDYVTYPPRMVFKIVQAPNTTETILEHALKVEGISPIKDFNIMVLPHSVVSTRPPPSRCSSDETTASASSYNSFSSCTSSENDRNESGECPVTMKDLLKILKPAASMWRMLAVNLELGNGDISRINKDLYNSEEKLMEVLSLWMDNVAPERNKWRTIYEAVRDTTGQEKLAQQINVKFLLK